MIETRSFCPRPCQHPMIDHIIRVPRCAVWAGMGLGKSSAVLDALETLNLVEDIYPALIIAPLRVARSTWVNEIKKWYEFQHLRISPIVGSQEERLAAIHKGADIYTVNFENLPWLVKYLTNWPFVTCVIDEATKLSGFRLRQGTKRARSLSSVAHQMHRFIELTGTPAAKGFQALWGPSWFLDKGARLGRTFTAFVQRWFRIGFDGYTMEMLPGAQDEMQNRLKDICLSVDAADYFDLQKPIVNIVYVDLDAEASRMYKEMEKKMYTEIDGHGIEAFNAATRTGKCLQLANGAAYLDPEVADDRAPKAKDWKVVHDEKIEALESIIEEANGMPVLVAYNFKSDLARLKKAFPKGRHIYTEKDEDDFRAGKIQIAFAHPASLGHGVDGFQYVTNIVVFFGLTWSLENHEQFIERVGPVRQMQAGFRRNVFVYLIVARGTVDEDVIIRQETKRSLQDILLESMKGKGYDRKSTH